MTLLLTYLCWSSSSALEVHRGPRVFFLNVQLISISKTGCLAIMNVGLHERGNLFDLYVFGFAFLQCVSRGELLVSLSYQPVSHRLSVVVLKAKHLPKLDITGQSGSKYISIFSLFIYFVRVCVCVCVNFCSNVLGSVRFYVSKCLK